MHFLVDKVNRVFPCTILILEIEYSVFVLNYGQTPITKSRYLKYFTNEEQPYGENAIVAIMCYSGYNVEDVILTRFIKKGYCTTYFNMYEIMRNLQK